MSNTRNKQGNNNPESRGFKRPIFSEDIEDRSFKRARLSSNRPVDPARLSYKERQQETGQRESTLEASPTGSDNQHSNYEPWRRPHSSSHYEGYVNPIQRLYQEPSREISTYRDRNANIESILDGSDIQITKQQAMERNSRRNSISSLDSRLSGETLVASDGEQATVTHSRRSSIDSSQSSQEDNKKSNETLQEATYQAILQQNLNNRLESGQGKTQDAPSQISRIGNMEGNYLADDHNTSPNETIYGAHPINSSNETPSAREPFNEAHPTPISNDPPSYYEAVYDSHYVSIPNVAPPTYEQAFNDRPLFSYEAHPVHDQNPPFTEQGSYIAPYEPTFQNDFRTRQEEAFKELEQVSPKYTERIDRAMRGVHVADWRYAQILVPEQREIEINVSQNKIKNPEMQNLAPVEIPKQETQKDAPEQVQESQESPAKEWHKDELDSSKLLHLPEIEDGSDDDSANTEVGDLIIKKKEKKKFLFMPEISKKGHFDSPIIPEETKKRQKAQELERMRREQEYQREEEYFRKKSVEEFNKLAAEADYQAKLARFYEQRAREIQALEAKAREIYSKTRREILGY